MLGPGLVRVTAGTSADGVVARNLYIDRIRDTQTFADIALATERFRSH